MRKDCQTCGGTGEVEKRSANYFTRDYCPDCCAYARRPSSAQISRDTTNETGALVDGFLDWALACVDVVGDFVRGVK